MSNFVVLAWILKYSVEEFSEYEIEQIQDMIEGEPDISRIRLEPGLSAIPLLHRFHKEKIDGLPTENRIREEGTIYFDILFYVRLPEEDELIKMIINVEAQNQFLLSLVPRGFFYCARMVSRQMRREFTPPDYGKSRKSSQYGCVLIHQTMRREQSRPFEQCRKISVEICQEINFEVISWKWCWCVWIRKPMKKRMQILLEVC